MKRLGDGDRVKSKRSSKKKTKKNCGGGGGGVLESPSRIFCTDDDGDERMYVTDSPSSSSSSSMDYDEVDDTVRETGSDMFEDTVDNDILFYMFSKFWARGMWFDTMLVCKRWKMIGDWAFNPLSTAKSICYGVFRDQSLLKRLCAHQGIHTAKLDPELIEIVCQRVYDKDILESLIQRGIKTKKHWLKCLRVSITKSNSSAIDCLMPLFKSVYADKVTEADYKKIMITACSCSESEAMFKCVLSEFRDKLKPIIKTERFAVWCCRKGMTLALLCLIEEPLFRTAINTLHVYNYAMTGRIEMLVCKTLKQDAANGHIDLRLYGSRALKNACREGWESVVQVLLKSMHVDPSIEHQMPLRLAVAKGQTAVVRRLLEHPSCNPGYNNNEIVLSAIDLGHEDIVTHLVRDSRVDISGHRNITQSILCKGISCGFQGDAFTIAVFEKGANPNEYTHAPLRLAVQTRNYEMLRKLIRHENIKFNRAEMMLIMSILADVEEYKDVINTLMSEKRFSKSFDM